LWEAGYLSVAGSVECWAQPKKKVAVKVWGIQFRVYEGKTRGLALRGVSGTVCGWCRPGAHANKKRVSPRCASRHVMASGELVERERDVAAFNFAHCWLWSRGLFLSEESLGGRRTRRLRADDGFKSP